MSGRCDGCGHVGDVWCGDCLAPNPEDAVAVRRRLTAEVERLTLRSRQAYNNGATRAYEDVNAILNEYPDPAEAVQRISYLLGIEGFEQRPEGVTDG